MTEDTTIQDLAGDDNDDSGVGATQPTASGQTTWKDRYHGLQGKFNEKERAWSVDRKRLEVQLVDLQAELDGIHQAGATEGEAVKALEKQLADLQEVVEERDSLQGLLIQAQSRADRLRIAQGKGLPVEALPLVDKFSGDIEEFQQVVEDLAARFGDLQAQAAVAASLNQSGVSQPVIPTTPEQEAEAAFAALKDQRFESGQDFWQQYTKVLGPDSVASAQSPVSSSRSPFVR